MTGLEATLWAALVGAAVGGIFSLFGVYVSSCLTQRRERRQQVWQTEVNRIVALEEHGGQMVELIGSHADLEKIREGAADGLPKLKADAGQFRRHKGIAQAIRDLENGLSRLLDSKKRGEEWRELFAEVTSLYDRLLAECDEVTGKRHV
jgi:hypothetical protein